MTTSKDIPEGGPVAAPFDPATVPPRTRATADEKASAMLMAVAWRDTIHKAFAEKPFQTQSGYREGLRALVTLLSADLRAVR